MATWLEHQGMPHPVVLFQEQHALFSHRYVGQQRATASDDTYRVGTGVGIDAEENVTSHVSCVLLGVVSEWVT
ncbi:hypothetical protein D3C80_1754920 [compost metagenome]